MVALAETGRSIGSRYFASLAYPDFLRLWIASVCSHSSHWALIIARGALVKILTDSDLWVGMVTFAAMIPAVIVTPFAGYLADRFDRRAVMAWAAGINLAHNLVLAIIVVTGSVEAWHLGLLALINGCARSAQMPATQALLANTVPKEHLFNAVALNQAAMGGSRFVGALLLILVLWATAPWLTDNQDWVFFLSTVLYVAALGMILNIRTASRGVVEAGQGMGVVYRNFVGGLSVIFHHRLMTGIFLLAVAHCAFTMAFESLLPAISVGKLGMKFDSLFVGFAYLMLGLGLGNLVTSLLLAGVRSERAKGQLFLWLGVFSGITPIALVLSPNLTLAMVSVVGMGVSQGGFMTVGAGMFQALAPDAARGRVMALFTWHTQGFIATLNLINGLLSALTALTIPLLLGGGGIVFVVVMAGSFSVVSLRQLYGRGVPEEARPSVQAQAAAATGN